MELELKVQSTGENEKYLRDVEKKVKYNEKVMETFDKSRTQIEQYVDD